VNDRVVGAWRTPRNLSADAAGSIHDDATAAGLGFRGGTVAGNIHMDLLPPLLTSVFGETWFETGSLSLYFQRATTDAEPVQAWVDRPVGGAQQVACGIVTEDGGSAAEGTASIGADGSPPRCTHATCVRSTPPRCGSSVTWHRGSTCPGGPSWSTVPASATGWPAGS
jgi:hypothetical protein